MNEEITPPGAIAICLFALACACGVFLNSELFAQLLTMSFIYAWFHYKLQPNKP